MKGDKKVILIIVGRVALTISLLLAILYFMGKN